MEIKLPGVALITGAASGMGRLAVKSFAEAGCSHIVIIDLETQVQSMHSAISEFKIDPKRISVHGVDITNDKAVQKIVQEIPEKFGSLDYAINAAGVAGKMGTITDVTMEDLDFVLNINLRAQIVLNRAEASAMLSKSSTSPTSASSACNGVIINYSSALGQRAWRTAPAYSIAKHGLNGLTRVMASTFGEKGLRTVAVAPGWIDTPMISGVPAPHIEALKSTIPMQRLGTSQEIVDLTVFLCSDGASYMNGSIVSADGGWTC